MKRQVVRLLTFLCITVSPIKSVLGQEQDPFIRSGSVGTSSRDTAELPERWPFVQANHVLARGEIHLLAQNQELATVRLPEC